MLLNKKSFLDLSNTWYMPGFSCRYLYILNYSYLVTPDCICMRLSGYTFTGIMYMYTEAAAICDPSHNYVVLPRIAHFPW